MQPAYPHHYFRHYHYSPSHLSVLRHTNACTNLNASPQNPRLSLFSSDIWHNFPQDIRHSATTLPPFKKQTQDLSKYFSLATLSFTHISWCSVCRFTHVCVCMYVHAGTVCMPLSQLRLNPCWCMHFVFAGNSFFKPQIISISMYITCVMFMLHTAPQGRWFTHSHYCHHRHHPPLPITLQCSQSCGQLQVLEVDENSVKAFHTLLGTPLAFNIKRGLAEINVSYIEADLFDWWIQHRVVSKVAFTTFHWQSLYPQMVWFWNSLQIIVPYVHYNSICCGRLVWLMGPTPSCLQSDIYNNKKPLSSNGLILKQPTDYCAICALQLNLLWQIGLTDGSNTELSPKWHLQ